MILPVLFLTSSFVKKEDIRKIALAFSAGVFVYTLFLGIYKFFSLDILQFDDFTHANIAIYHPSYLSIYVAFAIAVMIDTLLGKPFNRLILLFAISYLTVFCFLLASKVAILGLFLSLLYYLFLGLKRKGAKYVSVFVITLFSGFLILLVYSPNLKNRLITSPMSALANYKKVDSKDQASWPISFRIQILDCTKTLLENGNILYGYGTGDSNDELKKCYREKEYGWLMVRDLNSHNEYLNILLKVGLVGLCLLLICLFYPFFTGKGFTENKMYFVFLVLTILVFLGENFLDRHKGVIFYSFFNSLFMLGITPKRL
ncbi:MAG: O-antigen ligase family protein [Bacteroidota bacterium]